MKYLFTLLLMIFSVNVYAQPANIVNAYNYLKSDELDKAKEAIDKASSHPKTSLKSKTWRYKGDIYYAIAVTKKTSYKKLHANPAKVILESYSKAKTLDAKSNPYIKDMNYKLRIIQNITLNEGVVNYNNKKYNDAIDKFKSSVAIAQHLKSTDSLALFNVALASERANKTNQAIEYYRKCIDVNYRGANCCGFIVFLLQKQGKDTESLKQIKECLSKYPNDINLLTTLINLNLKNGNFNSAKENLQQALKNEPDNHVLHFSLGTVLDNMKESEAAEKSYLKAISLKGDFFDANYNLGALYFNKGVNMVNGANEESDVKKAQAITNEADKIFRRALPYLEKSRQLKPKDRSTLQSLKQLYARLGETEKYKEVKAALQE